MMAVAPETEKRSTLITALEANTEKLLTCVHCGLCLPACPTYRQLGNENDSPRGRLYLMRGLVEDKLEISAPFISHIDLCLGCRGCETVCPSGVPYGHLLEAARFEVANAKSARGWSSETRLRFLLNRIFTRNWLLRTGLTLGRWFRDSGLARAAFKMKGLPDRVRFALALLLASRSPLRSARRTGSVRPPPEAAARVALLRGCVMQGLFREANRATERVLARNGCELVNAEAQGCCGALHSHAGQAGVARQLARINITAFLNAGADRIVVNAAGCGAAMKEYHVLLADDPLFADRAREFSSKVRDVSEYLMETGLREPVGRVERRVAYDAPCHLIHAQRISQAPIDLLRAVPGVTLVPLSGSETCCGGAGIYNLQHPELSNRILSEKITSVRESGADTVASANPGCIMQIGAGILLSGLKVDVVHPIELLDAAYGE